MGKISNPGEAQGMQPEGVRPRKDHSMLMTIAVALVVLWILGLVTSYTLGGFLHVLLIAALAIVVVRFFQDRGVTT